MAKILMSQTMPGSMDGITTNLYIKGQKYEVDEDQISQKLADIFVNAKWATVVRERTVAPAETAVVQKAPEIKAEPEEAPEKLETKTELETEEESAQAFSDQPEAPHELKTTRVFELAQELEIPYKEVIKLAADLDIYVKVAQSGLSDSEVKRIRESFEK